MKCVFIVLDTVRRDYLSTYGNDWVHTPIWTGWRNAESYSTTTGWDRFPACRRAGSS